MVCMKAMFDSIEKGSNAGLAEQFELFFFFLKGSAAVIFHLGTNYFKYTRKLQIFFTVLNSPNTNIEK